MNVIWEQSGGVGRITLNRPDSLNAWTDEFGRELKQAITVTAAQDSVRAVIITGAGRGFSSGADLKAGFDPHPDDGLPDIRKELDGLYHPIIAGVRRLEKPVVAAVNGPAVGIGASLAFACDLVLAAESAFFGLAFVNIGLMPDGGSTLFVPAAVGKARAFQMALLGERVPADRALEWGLVNYVYPDDRLMDEANTLVEQLASGPTRSYAGSKRALNRMLFPDLDGQLDLEAELQHALAAPRTSRRAWPRSWRSARPLSRDPGRSAIGAGRRSTGTGAAPWRGGPRGVAISRLDPAGGDRATGSRSSMWPLRELSPAGRPPEGAPAETPLAPRTKWSPSRSRIYDPAALPTGMPRRLLRPPSVAVVFASLIWAPSALADTFTPESGGSPNGDDIDTLYKLTLYIGIVIFLLVWGVLIWSLIKYRARRDGVAQQIRGNTPLEIGWTIGAASILVVLTVVTFLYLDDIENPPASARTASGRPRQFASIDQPAPPKTGGPILTIHVNGQQYIWRYDYPGPQQLFSYAEMVVPTDTTVVLKIEASDVIHSWWIPKFGPKADAVPGHVNDTWFKVPAGREGIYRGQCAELCGPNHADMRAVVRAVKPDEFEAWASGEARPDQGRRRGRRPGHARSARRRGPWTDGSRDRHTPRPSRGPRS